MVPLTAREYLATYIVREKQQEAEVSGAADEYLDYSFTMDGFFKALKDVSNSEGLEQLDLVPLLDTATLERAWPNLAWNKREAVGLPDVSGQDDASEGALAGPRPLMKTSMEQTIRSAFGDGDVHQWFEQAERLPGFMDSVGAHLKANPSLVEHSPSGFSLLCTFAWRS